MFLLQYFLKLSVSLAVIYLFYYFILRRLTFYYHNRWYLFGYSVLCFFIALININPVLEKNELLDNGLVKAFPNVHDLTDTAGVQATTGQGWSSWNWTVLIFFTGFVALVTRLILQYISFCRIRNKAELLTSGPMNLYRVNKIIIPFSFGNSIFINESQHNEQELREIIRHEFVHVKQKHTVDIIWSELLCALNWFNPFAWLLRKAIRQNLEFIADNNVLESGMDKKQYQYLLLKVIGISQFSIANQFNFSSLKKRIAMMNKIKTAKVHLLKSLFVLPVIAMLLLAFRSQMHDRTPLKTNVSDSLPFKTLLDRYADVSLHRSDAMDQSHRDFFERNKDVQLLHWKKDGSLQIYLEDRVEKYLPGEFQNAEAKYGKLPTAAEGSHGQQVLIIDTVPEQTIPNSKGYLIDIKGEDGHCIVVVKDKNKKLVEKIDLLKWKDQQGKYERLYGEIPAPPVVAVTAPLTVNGQQLFPSVVATTVIGSASNLSEVPLATTIASTTRIPTNVQMPIASTVPGTALIASTVQMPVGTTIPSTANINSEVQMPNSSTMPVVGNLPTVVGVPVIPADESMYTGEKTMELKIYRSARKADLDNLINQAKTNGVDLQFEDIKYNEKDQLVAISGNMKKGDVTGNFVASDFAVVRLLLYKKDDGKYAFRVVVSDKGELS